MERRESEAQAQAAVFDWARWEQSQTPVLKAMYHAANEGKRSVRAGADLKRQGMKPDRVFLFVIYKLLTSSYK